MKLNVKAQNNQKFCSDSQEQNQKASPGLILSKDNWSVIIHAKDR